MSKSREHKTFGRETDKEKTYERGMSLDVDGRLAEKGKTEHSVTFSGMEFHI